MTPSSQRPGHSKKGLPSTPAHTQAAGAEAREGLYSRAQAARMLGVSAGQLRYWAQRGLVCPTVRRGKKWRYDFKDLLAIRQTRDLLARGLKPGQIPGLPPGSLWGQHHDPSSKPSESPDADLSSLFDAREMLAEWRSCELRVEGKRLFVHEGGRWLEASSGQLLLQSAGLPFLGERLPGAQGAHGPDRMNGSGRPDRLDRPGRPDGASEWGEAPGWAHYRDAEGGDEEQEGESKVLALPWVSLVEGEAPRVLLGVSRGLMARLEAGDADDWYEFGSTSESAWDQNSVDDPEFVNAKLAYERAIELQADHAPALTNLGTIHAYLGEMDAARDCYDAAIQSDPELFEPRCNLAELALRDGDAALAKAIFEQLLARHEDPAAVFYGLARAHLALEEHVAALEALERYCQLLDESAEKSEALQERRLYIQAVMETLKNGHGASS